MGGYIVWRSATANATPVTTTTNGSTTVTPSTARIAEGESVTRYYTIMDTASTTFAAIAVASASILLTAF